jgi:STE24 endopeptidase
VDVGRDGDAHVVCEPTARVRIALRLPLTLVAAVVVAEVAVLALRPRDLGPEPVPVEAASVFTGAQIQRAEDFRDGQRVLYFGQVAVELIVLTWLVARPPGVLRRARRRPALAGAAAAAGVALTVSAAALPLRIVARERAKDVGLVTQSWTGYAGDVVKAEAIGAAIAAAGGALLIVALRRFGRRWWIAGAVAVVGYGVAVTYLAPVLLEPRFNRFEALPAGELRRDVLELAEQAGVDVGEVYEMDASRRTTAANAYVAGLGATKRVVLYDTLLRDFEPAEVRLIVAHELGHVHYRDVPHGLLWLALVAPAGMLAVARLADALARSGLKPAPAAVPAVALAIALVVPVLTAVSNQLSRDVERRADAFSLRLTGEAEAFAAMQKRLAITNVSDPEPPGWAHAWLGTHPTTMERLGLAEAFRGAGGGRPVTARRRS